MVPQGPDLGVTQSDPVQKAYETTFAEIVAIVKGCAANIDPSVGGDPFRDQPEEQSLRSLRQFRETLQYDGSRYTVGIPLGTGVEKLTSNFRSAIRILRSQLDELRGNQDDYKRYHSAIMSLVEDGHAERVEDFPSDIEDHEMDGYRGRYFASHELDYEQTDEGVKWKLSIQTSSRFVDDPGETLFMLMLNDFDETDPKSENFLLNFRLQPVAFFAHIASANLCINIDERYRLLFQILWQGPDDDRIQCYQLKKLFWGAMEVKSLLKTTLKEHFSRVNPESLTCLDSFFDDEVLQSFPTVEEAAKFVDSVQDNLRSAGMELEDIKTNSRSLADHINGRGSPELHLNVGLARLFRAPNASYSSVSSLSWCPMDDSIRFRLPPHWDDFLSMEFTDWLSFLQFAMSIKDESGLFNPFLIQGRPLIWEGMNRWRDHKDNFPIIKGETILKVKQWVEEIETLLTIRVPRCISPKEKPCTDCHLHVFMGTSAFTNAIVVYVQTFSTDGESKTSIVGSSAEVERTLSAPERPGDPKLRVVYDAAVAVNEIRANTTAPSSRVLFYTDSMTTYRRLWFWSNATADEADAHLEQIDPTWKYFESYVDDTFQGISPDCYLIPKAENVAHLITIGGISAEELRDSRAWWHGPEWIRLPESDRPTTSASPSRAQRRNSIDIGTFRSL